jgi:sulfate adenylyltransferase
VSLPSTSAHGPWQVGVALPSEEATSAALAAGGLILRDEEHTPLAELDGPCRLPGRRLVVAGTLRRLRQRESGVAADTSVDFDDEHLRGRPLVLLERPPLPEDVAALRDWAAGGSAPPVLLVPEHTDGRAWVPTPLLLRLAHHLARALDVPGCDIRTVPLEPHDPLSDATLVHRIATRLGARDVRSVSDTAPAGTAETWRRAHAALVEGRPHERLPGLDPAVEEALRGWLPPRTGRGVALMFSGLSGSGKSTLARDVAAWLGARTSRRVTLLDGDRVRQMLSSELGFDRAARELNVRRIGYVAAEVVRHGGIAICSPIAPFAHTRDDVRSMVERWGDFVLVHVSTPIEECERRDLKGLYAKARAGRIADFTGISSPYDVPHDADLRIDTSTTTREDAAQQVVEHLVRGGWVEVEAS